MKIVLGFDTSCYTTSMAAVDENGHVVSSQRMLLPVEQGQRGLRQSEAVFVHVRQMPKISAALRAKIRGMEIAAVCASSTPRAEEQSYMPVFTVGLGQARVLADALDIPCYEVSHQQGHIAAGLLGNPKMEEPFIALHVSGGTTELLLCRGGTMELLGGSLDLHAGQLVDRIGVSLGLGFPAGSALEKLAMGWTGEIRSLLPASIEKDGLHCHLSGAETRCMQWMEAGDMPPEQMAAELFDLLARTVARLLAAAADKTQCKQALVVGGVASSTLLREMLFKRLSKMRSPVSVVFGQPCYSADNAAGVAWLGMQKYLGANDASR